MKRLFIAINLSDEIKQKLARTEQEIAGLFDQEIRSKLFKWVSKDNLHLTLLFLGAVEEAKLGQLCEIVKRVGEGQKPFAIKFNKICYGPPKIKPPRLIWLEIEKNQELLNLAEAIKKRVGESGILRKIEQRDFSPHITLARIRTWLWRQIEPEERPEVEREPSLGFEVKSVEIMESQLKRAEAEYSVLKSFNL